MPPRALISDSQSVASSSHASERVPGSPRHRGGASARTSVEDSFFAVLYVMHNRGGNNKGKGNRALEIFNVLIDWIQMMAFVADSSRFNWVQLELVQRGLDILFALVPRHFLEASGYPIFLILYAIVVALVVGSLADALWVLQSFRLNQFTHLWPIKALKIVVSVFFNSLYLSSLGILLMSLDCHYFDGDGASSRFTLTKYPEIRCWGFPNALVATVAAISSVAVLVFALSLALVDVDPNPSSTSSLSTATSNATVGGAASRALLVVVAVVFSNLPPVLALCVLVIAAYLAASVYYYLPHYDHTMNELRAALYCEVVWCAACAFALSVAPQHPRIITITFVAGFVPAFAAAWLAARRRFRALCDPALLVPEPEGGYAFLGRFRRPHEVEIATRFVRPFAIRLGGEDTSRQAEDQRALEEATEKADAVFQEGIRRFAKSAIVYIAYANFLRTFAGNSQMEGTYVDRARHLPLDFQLRFAVFRKDREREAGAAGSGGDGAMDLVSFVEFQKKFRLAKEGHFKALKATKVFWGALLEDDATALARISDLTRLVDTYETQAERNYITLVDKYPRNVRLLRAFGAFVEAVKNDPVAAEEYYRRADAEEEEQSKKTREEAEAGDDAHAGRLDNALDAVIVISAAEIVTSANANACRLLGYKKQEIVGKRVTMIVPPPFREDHTNYVQTYLRTGVAKVVNIPRELPAVHKEGHLLNVRLYVTRMDVNGEATFIGSIRRMDDSVPLCLATAAGRITGCNKAFAAMFETTVDEIKRKNVKELTPPRHWPLFSVYQPPPASFGPDVSITSLKGPVGGIGAIGHPARGGVSPSVASTRVPNRGGLGGVGLQAARGGAYVQKMDETGTAEIEALAPDGSVFRVAARVQKMFEGDKAVLAVTFRPVDETEGMITIDARGIIRAVNRIAADMWGFTPREMVNSKIETLMPAPFSTYHHKYMEAYFRTGVAKVVGMKRRVEAQRKDGSTFPMILNLSRVDVEDHVFFVGRVARAEEQEETDVYVTIDQRGVVQSLKGPFGEMFGHRPADIVGRNVSLLMPKHFASKHDEYMKRYLDDPSKPRVIGTGGRTVEALHKNSSSFAVQLDVSRDDSLAADGVVLFVGRMSKLADLDGLVTCDAHGTIMSCNMALCRIFGYPGPESLKDRSVNLLMAPSLGEEHQNLMNAYLTTGVAKVVGKNRAIVGRHSSGADLPISLELSHMRVGTEHYFSARIVHRAPEAEPPPPAAATPSVGPAAPPSGPLSSASLGEPAAGAARRRSTHFAPTLSAGPPPRPTSLSSIAEGDHEARTAVSQSARSGASLASAAAGLGLPEFAPVRRLSASSASGSVNMFVIEPPTHRSDNDVRSLRSLASARDDGAPKEEVLSVKARERIRSWADNGDGAPPADRSPPPEPAAAKPSGHRRGSESHRRGSDSHRGSDSRQRPAPVAVPPPEPPAAAVEPPAPASGERGTPAEEKSEEDAQSMSSSGSNRTRRQKRRRRILLALAKRPNTAIASLYRNILVSLAVLAVVALVAFVVIERLASGYVRDLEYAATSSERTVLSQLAAIEARTLVVATTLAAAPGANATAAADADAAAARLQRLALDFAELHKDLSLGLGGFGGQQSKAQRELSQGPTALTLSELRNGQVVATPSSLWVAGQRFAQHALLVASRLNATETAPAGLAAAVAGGLFDAPAVGDAAGGGEACLANARACPSWYYISRNGPQSLFGGLLQSTRYYDAPLMEAQQRLEAVYAGTFAASLILVAVLGLAVFRPTFARVRTERDAIMELFLEIPKPVIKILARKRIAFSLESSDDDSGTDDEEEQDGGAGAGAAGVAGAEEDSGGAENDRDNMRRNTDIQIARALDLAKQEALARAASRTSARGMRRRTSVVTANSASASPLPGGARNSYNLGPAGSSRGGKSAAAAAAAAVHPMPVTSGLANLMPRPSSVGSVTLHGGLIDCDSRRTPPKGLFARLRRAAALRPLTRLLRAVGLGRGWRESLYVSGGSQENTARRGSRRGASAGGGRRIDAAARGKGSEKLFRLLSLQYIAASALIAACFSLIFIAGLSVLKNFDDKADNIVMAAVRRSHAVRAALAARELVLPSAAPAAGLAAFEPALPDAAAGLAGDVAALRAAHARLADSASSTAALAALNFARGCLREDAAACPAPGTAYHSAVTGGLDALLTLYGDQGDLLATAPAGGRTVRSAAYRFVWAAGLTDVLDGCATAERLYVAAARDWARILVPVHAGLMCLTLAVIFGLLLLQFRPMVRRLRDETRRTHRMLQLIPDEITDKVDAIRNYIESFASEIGQ